MSATNNSSLPIVKLKPGRSHPFRQRHPWLFSGAIAQVKGNPSAGDICLVVDDKGDFIAYGLYNPHSQIRVRLYSFDADIQLNDDFWSKALSAAIHTRSHTLGYPFLSDTACRLVNSEGDGLSGLTIDCYGSYLILQFTSLVLYLKLYIILSTLTTLLHPEGIILRTTADMLKEEGMEAKDGLLYGTLPSAPLIIKEGKLSFHVDLSTGQKTGFYLDQRANRMAVEAYAYGRHVLDVCTYTGGFALHAASAGAASVTAVDVSASALKLAQSNAERNQLSHIRFEQMDMFACLEKALAEDKRFDLIILDPPKMTHARSSMQSALKGYTRLNAMALRLLTPGGMLLTCSCSGRITRSLFLEALHHASLLSGLSPHLVRITGADTDHPFSTACPETEYLKCCWLTV